MQALDFTCLYLSSISPGGAGARAAGPVGRARAHSRHALRT